MSFNITAAAATKVRELLETDEQKQFGVSAGALRIYVKGGGCSGYQYGFSLEPAEPAEDDILLQRDGVKFLVDCMSSTFLDGAELDYRTDGFNSYFSITNPNAKSTCGCGSSFAA